MEDIVSLKEKLLIEALIIIKSVNFLEKEINKKILEITQADEEYRDDDADFLRSQLSVLLKKLHREDLEMDVYLKKYRELIHHEKKDLLPSIISKKTFHIRSIPPNVSRA